MLRTWLVDLNVLNLATVFIFLALQKCQKVSVVYVLFYNVFLYTLDLYL